jgi:hypothetical protein
MNCISFQYDRPARGSMRLWALLSAVVAFTFSITCLAAQTPLAILTAVCPGGTQYRAYAGCRIEAAGGVPPYKFTLDNSGNYPTLPEGLFLNEYTGEIWGPIIGGQGGYAPGIIVTDSTGATAEESTITFPIDGDNSYMAGIFPPNSIFHHRVDAATTGLPVDTSPAAAIPSAYLTSKIHPAFGGNPLPYPNGIPSIKVPWNQREVPVSTLDYQSYFDEGPIPYYAPIEGSAFTSGDRHVLVYREAGPEYRLGQWNPEDNSGSESEQTAEGPDAPPALYEMWASTHLASGGWTDGSNALWPDVDTNQLTPQGNGPSAISGTADAAGLSISPLLVTADEVIGSGTPTNPKGVIRHPIRFTLQHMVNYWVWPATATAGLGDCTNSSGATISTSSEIYQPSPNSPSDYTPAACTRSAPAGEIYRLMAAVPSPACAATSPQAAIVIQAMRDYGIILADNGSSGFIVGTPDARWNDLDLACIKELTLADVEPVNVSSLMVSNDSGQTKGAR